MSTEKGNKLLSEFAQRLKLAVKFTKLKPGQVAEKAGVSPQVWRKYEAGKTEPGITKIKFLSEYKISLNWLLVGEGEMEIRQGPQLNSDDAFTLIPKYKAKLSGGHGSLETSDQIISNLSFRKEWITARGNQNNMALFEVTGDSMRPMIADNDVVLVDRSYDDLEDIVTGKVYAFREEKTIWVKRLTWEGATLVAVSDNDKTFKPYNIDMDNFSLIGRVIWVGHEVK